MVDQLKELFDFRSDDSDNCLNIKQQVTKISDNSTSNDSLQIEVSEIDQERVLYFKREIASNNYQIQSDKIARSILNNLEIA